jgi:hypothetical protein
LSLKAKLEGQQHLDLGERRIIPFGNLHALELMVATSVAYGREVSVLVDGDDAGLEALRLLNSAGYKDIPIFSLNEFTLALIPGKGMAIEDIFDSGWYIEQVNGFYDSFTWYNQPLETSDLSSAAQISKSIQEHFRSINWPDAKTHTFSKSSVAIHIASSDPKMNWKKLNIAFRALCERVVNPLGLYQLGFTRDTRNTDISSAEWAAVFNISIGINPGIKEITISTISDKIKSSNAIIHFPSEEATRDLVVWDIWEKKRVFASGGGCLRYGTARLLLVGSEALSKANSIQAKVMFIDGTSQEYECLFSAGNITDPWERFTKKYKTGDIIEGIVCQLSHYSPAGFYVDFEEYGIQGFVHISQISDTEWVQDVNDVVTLGQTVRAKIRKIDPGLRSLQLTLKNTDTTTRYSRW